MWRTTGSFLLAAAMCLAPMAAATADEAPLKRTEDVIYGRKFGVALTMDVFTPEKPNGLGVVLVVSGGWFSAHEGINPGFCGELLDRGYTVFAVVHGSQPKFAIPEILTDMHRAVRYIRHHAADYGVDPARLGIMGGSAGGHLSLMQGTAGTPGDPKAADPVERESSRVQAVACFFPPTDFLNYGKPGEIAIGRGVLKDFRAPFDFEAMDDQTHRFVEITDEAKIEEIGREISPITHVSSDDPPTLIIHGDADELVPIQQATIMVEALEAAGVEAQLVTKPGAKHGWPNLLADTAKFADWFDAHLASAPAQAEPADAAEARLEVPATDEGLPGAGPVRRSDSFRKTWRNRRAAFAQREAGEHHAVVFFGDSITQGWGDDFARAHGAFGDMKVANRGVSGDTTRGMLVRLEEDVIAIEPRGVVMLMGTNDLAEKAAPETIVGNIELIVDRLHEHDAKLPIVVCLVMPSSAEKDRPADKIQEINRLLVAALQDRPHLAVLDTWTLFADEHGDAKSEEFPDLLHPNDKGYAKWTAALAPLLESAGLVEGEADASAPRGE
jgi:acetyl esterase/lipase/lysophospholipase L1-like esterase